MSENDKGTYSVLEDREKYVGKPLDPILLNALEYAEAHKEGNQEKKAKIYGDMLKQIFNRFPSVKDEIMNSNVSKTIKDAHESGSTEESTD